MPDLDPDILTTAELALRLNLPSKVVLRMTREGRIPKMDGSGGRGRGHGNRYSWRAVREALDVEDTAEPATRRDPDILTTEELAAKVGFYVETVRNMANAGVLPGLRAGRDWRFYWPAVRERFFQPHPVEDRPGDLNEAVDDRSRDRPTAARSRQTGNGATAKATPQAPRSTG